MSKTTWRLTQFGEIMEDPHTIIAGEDQPKFVDGSPMPDCEEIIFRIQACTWEEAMAIYYLRMGYEPYKPAGNPGNCPKCDSFFYPSGSGECWRCGKICWFSLLFYRSIFLIWNEPGHNHATGADQSSLLRASPGHGGVKTAVLCKGPANLEFF